MSKRIRGIRSWLRLPQVVGRVASEVDDEIAFHLEERARALVERGMTPSAARAEAEREFGDLGAARAELEEIGRRRVRQARRRDWWGELWLDVRYAARGLLRSRGFTLVAVLTLALGIGATTAIYSLVDAVMLRPLGVAEPERLVVVWENNEGSERNVVSPANYFDWREQARSFSELAFFWEISTNLTGGGGEPEAVQAQLVSANFFTALGVQPLLGRGFLPGEDEPGDQRNLAVLSYALWQSRFGGDPGIVGKTVVASDQPLTIVGVMGPDFRVLDTRPALWAPVSLPPGDRTNMGRFITTIGRLKPAISVEEAQAEMSAIARRLAEAFPEFNTGWGATVLPLREQVVGEVRPALLVLLGAVAMLLLIACTNVANLLLSRASARRQEIAVRLSLGATRGRLVRQLLTESVVLSLLGGAVGFAVAVFGTGALLRSLPESVQLPRLDAVSMDGRVLAFALGVTLLTGVLFGLAPALAASRAELQGVLRDAGRGSTAGRSPTRLRNGLVVAEVALALLLLVGAGLLLRSFQKLLAVDTGMRNESVLTFRLGLTTAAYDTPEALRGFVDRLLPDLESLPGVEAVGTISYLPLTGEKSATNIFRPDRPRAAFGEEPGADIRVVDGDYFTAQGIRLVSGRAFDERDHADAPLAFIINEALARELFPGEEPLGQRLSYEWGDTLHGEVVGVVGDIREMSLTEQPSSAIYRALPQQPFPLLNVVIRSSGEPMALAAAARERVRALDPDLPLTGVRPMQAVVANATARSRLSGYLLGGFAGMALLLAAIGLYGIIAYGVAQRRAEIGIRMALGAGRGDIVRLIVREGMVLTLAGTVLGLLGAFALTHFLRTLLFGVTATDPTTFVGVALLLATVSFLASYLPASRAARTDPMTALRAE